MSHTTYFPGILNPYWTQSLIDVPPDSNEMEQLDYIITLDELGGIDNLSNEMIYVY